MRRYDQLELQWRLARLRKIKRLALFATLLLFFIVAMVMVMKFSQPPKAEPKTPPTPTTTSSKHQEPTTPPPSTTSAPSQERTVLTLDTKGLRPSSASSLTFPTPSSAEKSRPSSNTTPTLPPPVAPSPSPSTPSVAIDTTPPPSLPQPPMASPTPTKLSITSSSADLIATLEQKFDHSPSYATAITLAQEYYERGDYAKALKWSSKANDLDNRKAESWILFAKSHYKLGKRDLAIRVLQEYLERQKSDEAQQLLARMQKGGL